MAQLRHFVLPQVRVFRRFGRRGLRGARPDGARRLRRRGGAGGAPAGDAGGKGGPAAAGSAEPQPGDPERELAEGMSFARHGCPSGGRGAIHFVRCM